MKSKQKKPKPSAKVGQEQSIIELGMRAMRLYADEVNLDRAVPDLDGLKPVQRRILWAASHNPKGKFVKTAQVAGDVMGKYHPHAESSGSIETMVNAPTPLLHGEGNWGNLVDPAAAMRYTLCRLSNLGALTFNPDYMNDEVTTFVPNYSDNDVEPVTLPFHLPNILLNGGEGIGYGTACSLPTFTPESVAEVLTRLLKGEKLKAPDIAGIMKPKLKWGGQLVKSKDNRKAWLEMFTGTKASVQYEAPLEVDGLKRTLIIRDWPPGLNPVKFIEWVRGLTETQEAYPSKGSMEFTIVQKKGYNSVQFDAWVKKIQDKARVKVAYNINVTRRTATITDGVVDYNVALLALSVPQIIIAWLRNRLEIEVKSLNYRIRKQKEAIAYSDLLIWAASHLEQITPIIKSSPKPREELMKKFKLTEAQANLILDLTLRKLSRIDQDEIAARRKDQKTHLAQLETWLAKPKKKVLADIDTAMEAYAADVKYFEKVETQELKLR